MKKYKTIYADPPWNQTGGGKIKRGADRHYPLLKESEILKVMKDFLDGKVEDNAHLYMWVANNHLPEALRIIENLGFRYITNIVWAKSKIGLGQYFRGQHEICLFAVKGNGFTPKKSNNSLSSLIGGKPISAKRHSKKPEETYELIEARSEGPYLEMFARNYRSNWDSFGNEVVYNPSQPIEKEEESDEGTQMTPHPTRICDTYLETKDRCAECMTPDEEIDFWRECYNGKHDDPSDCPTWYDWCNCGGTMFETIEYLKGERDSLERELKEAKGI